MVSFYFKNPDDLIYLLGATNPELGASEYYQMNQIKAGQIPKVDSEKARTLYDTYYQISQKSIISSAHDLSDGGLAIALSEAAFASNFGAKIDLQTMRKDLTIEEKLFSESASRVLVTVRPEYQKQFEQSFKNHAYVLLGQTTIEKDLVIQSGNQTLISESCAELKSIWQNALQF